MPKTGTATLPLHYGAAPRWLFEPMAALSREIVSAVPAEFGPKALLAKLSDPYWFQALGCVLGFEWHSSGLTTTVTGALKEGIRGLERELGLFLAGGKGAASRKTPSQITGFAERLGISPEPLVYASRMSAKVDNAAVQDGYQLYHHVFAFTSTGEWAAVQQAPSYRDPARFSFAHGGKDGTPFPVDRPVYDRTVEVMEKAIRAARVGDRDRPEALRRLSRFYGA